MRDVQPMKQTKMFYWIQLRHCNVRPMKLYLLGRAILACSVVLVNNVSDASFLFLKVEGSVQHCI